MPSNQQTFTITFPKIVSTIASKCAISLPYDPARGGKHPPIREYDGIWDTGATGTVITDRVVNDLGLKPIGKTIAYNAHGKAQVDVYLVNVFLPNNVGIPSLRVTKGNLQGADVLIGMDVIHLGDFALTNKNKKTTFSFRTPSSTTIDFKSAPIGKPFKGGRKIGRNTPCPCNSGKKHKQCCGKK